MKPSGFFAAHPVFTVDEARKALQLALELGLNEDDALTSRKLLNVMGVQ